MLDEPDDTWRDRANAEIQDVEMEALEIWHIARDMEVEDLAIARARDLVRARDTVLNEETARGALARVDDVLAGTEFGDPDGEVFERRLLVLGESEDATQLSDEKSGVVKGHERRFPCCSGKRRALACLRGDRSEPDNINVGWYPTANRDSRGRGRHGGVEVPMCTSPVAYLCSPTAVRAAGGTAPRAAKP